MSKIQHKKWLINNSKRTKGTIGSDSNIVDLQSKDYWREAVSHCFQPDRNTLDIAHHVTILKSGYTELERAVSENNMNQLASLCARFCNHAAAISHEPLKEMYYLIGVRAQESACVNFSTLLSRTHDALNDIFKGHTNQNWQSDFSGHDDFKLDAECYLDR